jgi:hypothetical protein
MIASEAEDIASDEASATSRPSQIEDSEALTQLESRIQQMSSWAATVGKTVNSLVDQVAILAQQASAEAPGRDETMLCYRPTPEQLCELFSALAEWQAAAPVLIKAHSAAFNTRDQSGRVEYDYASPGDVSQLARTAGKHGLSHFHVFTPSAVRTYLVHKGGGYFYADVPIMIRDNAALSPVQRWSAATTAARRLGILAVMGILPDDADDAGNPRAADSSRRGARTTSLQPPARPRPLPPENVRHISSNSQPEGA